MTDSPSARSGPHGSSRPLGLWLSATLVTALALAGCASPSLADEAVPEAAACPAVGSWIEPASGAPLETAPLMAALAERPVVLLGESHDNAEHHRWQLHMLAALHARRPDMVIGFEMFPRRVQPALDAWVAGDHDVAGFLKAADWAGVWGFAQELYLPLFHFARQNRVPMVALNVERSLVSRVGRRGWAAVPAAERETRERSTLSATMGTRFWRAKWNSGR